MGSAPEPTAHAIRAAHRGTMMPAHGRTAIAPAAQEGESPIPRTAEQRRQDQDDDDEAQHWLAPPFVVFVARGIYVKRLASRSPAMQVLPSRWNRMLLHRLTVCNHALAFGYSLATMIVYQISLIFER